MRIIHPHYDRKRDRVTRIDFEPKQIDGYELPIATATVDDPDAIASLLARGFLPAPGEELPEELLDPEPETGPEDSDGTLEGATVQDLPTDDEAGQPRELPPPEELDTLTAAELRALADELDVDVPSKATKAEIRELLDPDA